MKNLNKLIFILFIVPFALVFTACDGKEILSYNIEVISSDIILGSTSGTGKYQTGNTVTLNARPTGTAKFLGWVFKDNLVSKENPYQFEINSNSEGKYIAVFDEPNLAWRNIKSAEVTGAADNLTNLQITIKLSQDANFLSTIYEGNIEITNGEGIVMLTNSYAMNLNKVYSYHITIVATRDSNSSTFVKEGKISKAVTGVGITPTLEELIINQTSGRDQLFNLKLNLGKV